MAIFFCAEYVRLRRSYPCKLPPMKDSAVDVSGARVLYLI